MKIILYLTLSTSLFGCTSPQIILGEYKSKYNGYTSESIELKNDSTFIFYWYKGLAGEGKTTGQWRIIGNKLLLNSDIQPMPKHSYSLIERSKNNLDSIHLEIRDSIGPMQGVGCLLYLDNKIVDTCTTNQKGVASFKRIKHNKITASFVGYRDIQFPVIDKNFNFYKFEMLPDEVWVWYFTNEKWKFKKGKLYTKKNRVLTKT